MAEDRPTDGDRTDDEHRSDAPEREVESGDPEGRGGDPEEEAPGRENGDAPAGDRLEVTVRGPDGEETVLDAPRGSNLRELLVERGCSPYTALTRRANCGGRGLCGTCGVRIEAGEAAPIHPHDRLADRFGYPRLSCQVTVEDDLVVRIPEKVVWGRREPDG